MITTALKQTGDKPVHISEVQRGLACGCLCADCRGKLIARKGRQRDHHFAHYTQTVCRGETNLHKMGKQILIDELRLTVGHPELDSPVIQRFETAIDEVTRGSIGKRVQIDCLMDIGNEKNELPIDITELAVEILVTHAVDEQKKTRLHDLGLQTIEIDLRELARPDSAPSKADIRKAICDTPSNINWIHTEEPEPRQLESVLDAESDSPSAELSSHVMGIPCIHCGAELIEEASVCTSCGVILEQTDIELPENQLVDAQSRRTSERTVNPEWFKPIMSQFLQTGVLAAPGTIPNNQHGGTAKPKRARKSTKRKKRKR